MLRQEPFLGQEGAFYAQIMTPQSRSVHENRNRITLAYLMFSDRSPPCIPSV